MQMLRFNQRLVGIYKLEINEYQNEFKINDEMEHTNMKILKMIEIRFL